MRRKVIIELRSQPLEFGLDQMQRSPRQTFENSGHLKRLAAQIDVDESFVPFTVPLHPGDLEGLADRAEKGLPRHNEAIRAEVDDAVLDELSQVKDDPSDDLDGVYVDLPMLEASGYCPTGAVGDLQTLEARLGVANLHALGMNGNNVLVAMIDAGISATYLHQAGRTNSVVKGWGYPPGVDPHTMPVTHGTMSAFNVSVVAPQATLWDFPIITPAAPGDAIPRYTSDGAKAYSWILNAVNQHSLLTKFRGLIVNNSWCIYDASVDAPTGHPANYSSNPKHPFNRAVSDLAAAGVDIVFAAGNCGADCPATACSQTGRTIYGANSHPDVLSVGAIALTGQFLGYSSVGPGYLAKIKPDLCAFSHFKGSQVGGKPDTGTSAAAPIAAGMIAAIRNKVRVNTSNSKTSPAALRAFLQKTAFRSEQTSWPRPDVGWGILNGPAIAAHFGSQVHLTDEFEFDLSLVNDS